MSSTKIILEGVLGFSARREVLLGFARSDVLYSISFADVLDEETGRGYQRRFSSQHSLDFRRYIQQERSSTIPLTFNVRPRSDGGWVLMRHGDGRATLSIQADVRRVLTQVDCQHRLGHLNDLSIPLPFMCYLGLTEREEMEVFSVINGKAKGLSTSLLDFHDARLASDLAHERPELFIALHLNANEESPWYGQLDLGGKATSGLARRASLRTMQKAIKRFLLQTGVLRRHSTELVARIVMDFWASVALVEPGAWSAPRRHLLSKGIGVYALMAIAGDLVNECTGACDKRYFSNQLSAFMNDVNWTASGPLAGLGGEAGVKSALSMLRAARRKNTFEVVKFG